MPTLAYLGSVLLADRRRVYANRLDLARKPA